MHVSYAPEQLSSDIAFFFAIALVCVGIDWGVIAHLICQLEIPTKLLKASKNQIVDCGCCFSLKMGVFHKKMMVKGEKLANYMIHTAFGVFQILSKFLTFLNSDKNSL